MWLIFVLKEGKHEALADKIANTPTKKRPTHFGNRFVIDFGLVFIAFLLA